MVFFTVLIIGLITVFAQQQQQEQEQEQEVQIPPFLEGASPETIEKFYKLLDENENKTDAEIDARVEAFTKELGGDYKQRFDDFKRQLKEEREKVEKARQAIVAKFSPAAKEADAKMNRIANNPNLSGLQKKEQIQAVMKSLSKETQEEIRVAFLNQ